MNEIERLIAGLPRPVPSESLDARIVEMVGRSLRHDGRRPFGLLVGALTTTAVCAGFAGFILGRASVSTATAAAEVQPATAAPVIKNAPAAPRPTSPTVVVALDPEALSRFMPPTKPVGLWGDATQLKSDDSKPFE
jgi:hypothetical protein